MNTINYSIIIPHKNIPQLLQRCLDSIPQREDVQIIVVDDCSSLEIVDFEHFPGNTRNDVKIVYISGGGKGAGYARNEGMKQAVGRWLLFADADDFFHSDMLRMLDEYKDSDSDLILFETDSVDSQTLRPVPSRTGIIAGLDEGMLRHGVRRAPWGKMVLRDLVERNKIRFEAVPASNDVLFSAYVGHLAHKVSVSSEILYCSTVRNDSLWYGMRREHLLVRIEVACRLAHLLHNWHESDRYRIYAYDFVKRSRSYGVKAYMTALCLYLRKERWHNIWCDFYNLVKVKYLKT